MKAAATPSGFAFGPPAKPVAKTAPPAKANKMTSPVKKASPLVKKPAPSCIQVTEKMLKVHVASANELGKADATNARRRASLLHLQNQIRLGGVVRDPKTGVYTRTDKYKALELPAPCKKSAARRAVAPASPAAKIPTTGETPTGETPTGTTPAEVTKKVENVADPQPGELEAIERANRPMTRVKSLLKN